MPTPKSSNPSKAKVKSIWPSLRHDEADHLDHIRETNVHRTQELRDAAKETSIVSILDGKQARTVSQASTNEGAKGLEDEAQIAEQQQYTARRALGEEGLEDASRRVRELDEDRNLIIRGGDMELNHMNAPNTSLHETGIAQIEESMML